MQGTRTERRIVFDLTDLLIHYSRTASADGIQRVVGRLVASEYLQRAPDVCFVIRAKNTGAFWNIDKRLFADLQRSETRSCAIVPLKAIYESLVDHVNYFLAPKLRKHPWKSFRRKYREVSRRIHEIELLESWCSPLNIEMGDVLVIPGGFWTIEDAAGLYTELRRRDRLHLVLFVYDLIPINDAWCVGEQHSGKFSHLLRILISDCDRVVVISKHVAGELSEYMMANGAGEKPSFILPFGWGFPEYSSNHVAERETLAKYGLESRNFILVVGTIERRKNHLLVARAAYSLYPRLRDKIPHILFVGKRGFGADFIEDELASMGFLGGRIRILTDTTDDELANLYATCQFTIFPSFVEGWGLPVQESLAFGRPCLASCATSIPEAGLDLATYFDPYDPGTFQRLLAQWIEQPERVSEEEARIARCMAARKLPGWEESATALMSYIRNGSDRP